MFEIIYEPSCIPLTIEEGYKRQNELLKKAIFLYTAFEGIKLNHFLDNFYIQLLKELNLIIF